MKSITKALLTVNHHPRIVCCSLLLFLASFNSSFAQLKPLNADGKESKVAVCKNFLQTKKEALATLNIFGVGQVQVGHTYIFWVQPSDFNNPSNPYTPIWNDEGYLDNKGTVSSTWTDATNGREYCTVSFSTPGWCWLTYYGPYNGYMDWGELSIEVLP